MSFDSNILVYAADDQDGRHVRAREVLDRGIASDCILALQALGEFFHVVIRKRIASSEAAQAQVEDWLTIYSTCAADGDALCAAIAISRRHGLSFWDAMLCATVKAAGCDVLLTEDLRDGSELDGMHVVNPFDPANDRLVDLVLPTPRDRP